MAIAGRSDARERLAFARTVESLGFALLLASDALARPRVEPLTVLAAVAAVTEHIRLETAALTAAIPHPLTSAHRPCHVRARVCTPLPEVCDDVALQHSRFVAKGGA